MNDIFIAIFKTAYEEVKKVTELNEEPILDKFHLINKK